jgi:hypothetical protein
MIAYGKAGKQRAENKIQCSKLEDSSIQKENMIAKRVSIATGEREQNRVYVLTGKQRAE